MVSCFGSSNKSTLLKNKHVTIQSAPFGKMSKNASHMMICFMASKVSYFAFTLIPYLTRIESDVLSYFSHFCVQVLKWLEQVGKKLIMEDRQSCPPQIRTLLEARRRLSLSARSRPSYRSTSTESMTSSTVNTQRYLSMS